MPVPRPSTFRPSRPGRRKSWSERESMKRDEPLGRVEEVERVAGRRRVEHEQVVAALLVQLVELLHRHVLLRAGHGVRELLVDAVREDGVARRSSGAWRSISSSKVRFASSIIAHSSPRISSPARRTLRVDRRSSLPSSGSPSELASRFAGSIVSTATFSPRAAMPIAIAAEVVVLPTPPEPAQMQISLPSSSRAMLTARPPSFVRSCSNASRSSSGSNRNGSATARGRAPRRRRASCSSLGACAAVLGQRRPQRRRARRGEPSAAARRLDPLGLLVGEALRVERVHAPPRRAPCPARAAARAGSRSSR